MTVITDVPIVPAGVNVIVLPLLDAVATPVVALVTLLIVAPSEQTAVNVLVFGY